MRRSHTVLSLGTSATDSLVERFGTFTIIVLGEVVLGVVAGLVSAERDGMTIAVGLLALIVTGQSLVDAERLPSVYRPLSMVLAIGAVAALVVGWVRPAPWLLALLLLAVLAVLWAFAVLHFLSADAWGEAPAAVD